MLQRNGFAALPMLGYAHAPTSHDLVVVASIPTRPTTRIPCSAEDCGWLKPRLRAARCPFTTAHYGANIARPDSLVGQRRSGARMQACQRTP